MPKRQLSSFFNKDGSPNRSVVRRASNPRTFALAKRLRKRMTPSESKLAQALYGFTPAFRKQSVILGWIADFYHPKSRLVIEVDGGYHNTSEQAAKDAHRDAVMQKHGFRVLRIASERVFEDLQAVVQEIVSAANSPTQRHALSPGRTMKAGACPVGRTEGKPGGIDHLRPGTAEICQTRPEARRTARMPKG